MKQDARILALSERNAQIFVELTSEWLDKLTEVGRDKFGWDGKRVAEVGNGAGLYTTNSPKSDTALKVTSQPNGES